MCKTYISNDNYVEICLTLPRINFIDEKNSDSHEKNENTIASQDNIEKHSSVEWNSEQSSEKDESSDNDRSFENETLTRILIITKTIALMV